jgi:hypothetical protein
MGMAGERRIEAVVFDMLFTLVHPGTYPGGTDREDWLATKLGIDPTTLEARWAAFEPELEAGRAPGGATGLPPELAWVKSVAAEFGIVVSESDMAIIDAQWDLTRRAPLLAPPPSTIDTLPSIACQRPQARRTEQHPCVGAACLGAVSDRLARRRRGALVRNRRL